MKVREDGDDRWTREITYGYDGNGNRTQVVTVTAEGTTTQTAKYAADDRLLCMSDGTTLTRFEYTGNGSLETKVAITTEDSCDIVPAPACDESCETTTYDYDAMGNLLSVALPDETIIAYDVDAAGRRIAKRVNGTLVKRWLWDGQLRPIAELAPNGSISSLFVYADGVNSPDYMIREGVAYTFVKDHLGSVRMVLDSRNGGIVQAVSYDAWGVPEVVAGGLDYQPFGFAGGLYNADTGLVRYGARDYDPALGRWLSKDPIRFSGFSLSLYAYADSEPLNRIDPNGETWVAVAVCAVIVYAIASQIMSAHKFKTSSENVVPASDAYTECRQRQFDSLKSSEELTHECSAELKELLGKVNSAAKAGADLSAPAPSPSPPVPRYSKW